MLIELRTKLRSKLKENITFDCQYIHLLGVAGILTEECKIWWSEKFKIDDVI